MSWGVSVTSATRRQTFPHDPPLVAAELEAVGGGQARRLDRAASEILLLVDNVVYGGLLHGPFPGFRMVAG